jgi:hypothetical protein
MVSLAQQNIQFNDYLQDASEDYFEGNPGPSLINPGETVDPKYVVKAKD